MIAGRAGSASHRVETLFERVEQVEQIIGKLIIDAVFRQTFKANRQKALASYQLTPTGRSGLMQVDVQAIELAVRHLQISRSISMESPCW
jgi:hypothetical protein